MRLLKPVSVILLLLAIGVGVIVLAARNLVLGPLERLGARATAETARVEMLADAPDAVILSAFVTGDVPRLLRGDALDRWSDALWFTDNADAASIAGAVLFEMGGMPPLTDIGTAFVDGAAVTTFACITAGCITWPNGAADLWGLGAVRGQGARLGPEVRLERQRFTDYHAYLDAHADVASDPFRWFSEAGGQTPQPDRDGLRLVVISLPPRLVSGPPNIGMAEVDAGMDAALTTLANTLIEGLGGSIEAIHGAVAMPLWVTKNDRYVTDADGATRALPDLVMHDPTLRLRVPVDAIPAVRTRLADADLAFEGASEIDAAVARAFDAWGLDTGCLPDCGAVLPPREIAERATVTVANPPSWTLSVWILPTGS